MTKINRYLSQNIIHMILLVSLVLLAIEFFILLINEFSHIGRGEYSLWPAMQFIILRMPAEFYELFPIVALMGCLLSLSLLANHSELIVLRAASFSLRDMIVAVLISASLVNGVMFMFGEVLAPWALHLAYNKKALEASHGQALRSREGLWFKSNGSFIHIKKIINPQLLIGIEQFAFDQHGKLKLIRFAKRAQYRNHHWQLSQVSETEIQERLRQTHFSQLAWALTIKPEFLRTVSLANRELNLINLYQQLNTVNHDKNIDYEFWQRLLKPILICIMMLLAIPFVFTAQYKSSIGARILIGLSFGFLYYFLQRVTGPIGLLYQLPPLIAALSPIFLFLTLGFFLFYQQSFNNSSS